jgi:hypothetical protein
VTLLAPSSGKFSIEPNFKKGKITAGSFRVSVITGEGIYPLTKERVLLAVDNPSLREGLGNARLNINPIDPT